MFVYNHFFKLVCFSINMEIFSEGNVGFYASKDITGKISKDLEFFYNPVMKFNRDISVALLNVLNEKNLQICDLMAGSGVRSLRFLKELNAGIIKSLVVNDNNVNFVELFKKNIELNKLNSKISELNVCVHSKDANKLLLESSGFDYIDIDPFGSPNSFLENSIVRLSRKGILAVTATDTAPLAGTFPDACKRKYWSKPIRNYLMHEIGLRILIRKIQLIGTQHNKALMPIYSYYKDHYFRIFLRCYKSKEQCDHLLDMHKYFLFCKECNSFYISDKNYGVCCGASMDYAGPLWTGILCDKKIAEDISVFMKDDKFSKIIAEESHINTIGFYDIHVISKKHKFIIPNYEKLLFTLNNKAKSSRTHFSKNGIKTTLTIKDLLFEINKINNKRINNK